MWLLLTASQAFAASSYINGLSTNTTNPLPAGSCLLVDQNSLDTKLCSNWATALGAMLPDLTNITATALPSGFTLPSPILTGTVAGANTIPYSILQQAASRTILGNATTGTANITAGWTVSGDSSKVATTTGTLTNGHCVDIDALGNFVDAGAACSSGGGGGSVTSVGVSVPAASIFGSSGGPIVGAGTISLTTTGSSGGVPYFSSGTQLSSSGVMPANHAITGGGAGASPKDSKVTITIPATGSTLTVADGKVATFNATTTFGGTDGKTVNFTAGQTFAGTDGTTQTFQATDTILGRATTDTLTNKTYDTAGTGNVFKIAGAQLTAISGTGATVALTTSPTFVTPTLGVASGTSLTLTPPAGTTKGLSITQTTINGAPGVTTDYNKIIGIADSAAIGTNNFGNLFASELHVVAGATGNRSAVLGNMFLDGNTGVDGNWQGGIFQGTCSVTQGGGSGTEKGACFGLGAAWFITSTNGFFKNASNEFNGGNTDSTTKNMSIIAAVTHNSHTTHASSEEAMLHFGSQSTTGFYNGITLSNINDHFPLDTTGTFLKFIGAQTIATLFDATAATITSNILVTPKVTWAGSGLLSVVNNINAAYPPSAATSWCISDNFSAGGSEVNFWNCDNSGGGFDWRQKTGASASTQLAGLNATSFFVNVPVKLAGYTVLGLPSGVLGMTAYVTNAVACTFLTAVASGGSAVCPVFYNGTNWVGG